MQWRWNSGCTCFLLVDWLDRWEVWLQLPQYKGEDRGWGRGWILIQLIGRGKRGNTRQQKQHYHSHIMSTTTERLNLIWGWDQYINCVDVLVLERDTDGGNNILIHVACSVASHVVSSLNHHLIINRNRMYSLYSWGSHRIKVGNTIIVMMMIRFMLVHRLMESGSNNI